MNHAWIKMNFAEFLPCSWMGKDLDELFVAYLGRAMYVLGKVNWILLV